MKKKLLSGILFSSAGSFWWGVIGVIYFKYVSFAGTVELVVHRTIWTAFILLLSIHVNQLIKINKPDIKRINNFFLLFKISKKKSHLE